MVVHEHHPVVVSVAGTDGNAEQDESKRRAKEAHKLETKELESSWHAALRKLKDKSNQNAELRNRVVDLQDIVRDVHEYHGVSTLGYFVVYFALANMVLFFHWDISTPILKSNIQQTFMQFGDIPSGNAIALAAVNNMYDAAQFAALYATNFIKLSEDRSLPNDLIMIEEYGNVVYMRMSAAIQENCAYNSLYCYSTSGGTDSSSFNSSGHWKVLANGISGVGLGSMIIADIISSDVTSRSKSLSIASNISSADLAFLSTYSYFTSVDMVVQNQLSSRDLVYISLQFQRNLGAFQGNSQVISTTSISTSLIQGLYVSKLDKARIAVEVLFLFMTVGYIMYEFDAAYLSYQQYRGADGITRYLSSDWAKIDIVSNLYSLAWCIWYIYLVVLDYSRSQTVTENASSINSALDYGIKLEVWLFAGIINCLLIGLRVLKHMTLQGSLRIYSKVLGKTWGTLRDFLFFFLYILILLGLGVLAFFQISGGNPAFSTIQGAIQSMGLLTFGFMDYPTFTNLGLGLGSWSPTIILVFWVVVMILIIISQNIVLSIVVSAYEESKQSEPFIEASIFSLMIHRALFEWFYQTSRLRAQPLIEFVEHTVNKFHQDLYLHGIGQGRGDLFTTYIRARWAICLLPEVQVIKNFFFDYGSQKFKEQSRWDPVYMNFMEVKHTKLLRSFRHLLNKVQNEEIAVEALIAATGFQDVGAEYEQLKVNNQEFKTASMHDLLSNAGAIGRRLSRVAPEPIKALDQVDPSGKMQPIDSALSADADFIGETDLVGNSKTQSGLVVEASMELPFDHEMLLHLMENVMCNNLDFVMAKHIIGVPLSRFTRDKMWIAADYIMKVYSFPVTEIPDERKREHVEARIAERNRASRQHLKPGQKSALKQKQVLAEAVLDPSSEISHRHGWETAIEASKDRSWREIEAVDGHNAKSASDHVRISHRDSSSIVLNSQQQLTVKKGKKSKSKEAVREKSSVPIMMDE
ncbi:hypothetical protein CEUSTIGMA_g13056.t1 [Chlamydomonas eustigma]|uniref:Polycystin cation channel PKD1/PKD2 domain-containing protein n=1 Tax=Chlamydomonas eustigma TaxID=1157962 RepID=A0A250XRD0_9CHLO|nr:hypothetical protein CEUSTIGMA_g13056.t1 [Chlamydomonas eustigma]|eukprot:GAX85641.1 hypothetical protein CEUSTIGMA_g13056.t1 [Chlamydomonas eustigma]